MVLTQLYLPDLLQRRVAESGRNGLAVQDHIRRLPPSHIRRNDFSHLGIQSPQDQQLDDAISVISATASATIPYAQVRTCQTQCTQFSTFRLPYIV